MMLLLISFGSVPNAVSEPIPPDVKSTAQDRVDLKLTVYENQALVSETRRVSLPSGKSRLIIEDVPKTIDPASLQILSSGGATQFRIKEQNYMRANITNDKLAQMFIGKNVVLIEKDRRINARLLSPGIYDIDGEVYVGHQGPVIYPKLPDGILEKAVLSCLIESKNGGEVNLEISYLAGGMGWNGSYTATVSENVRSIALQGWINVRNDSGAEYKNAQMSVIAGSVRRAQPKRPVFEARTMSMAGGMEDDAIVAKPVFDYHQYPIAHPITIGRDQEKRIRLFAALDCVVAKNYIFEWPYHAGQRDELEDKARIVLELKNSKSSGLGMPLPRGKVSVYKRSGGQLVFIGEDEIKDIPVDEEFGLFIGKAFDIMGKIKRTAFRSPGRAREEATFQLSIVNHQADTVSIEVLQNIPGDWDIVEATEEYSKKAANTLRFDLKVQPSEERIIEYMIRINRRW